LDYRFHWASGLPGFLRVSGDREGKKSAIDRNNAIALAPVDVTEPLTFVHASVGLEWRGVTWTLFGRNLTDEYRVLMPATSGTTAQARPRTFGVSLQKSF